MYGGHSAAFFNETWEWSGFEWTKRRPTTSPPAPNSSNAPPDTYLSYDPAHHRTLMMRSDLPDVWEWDGTTWTQVVSETTQRAGPLTWDAAHGRTLMFNEYLWWRLPD